MNRDNMKEKILFVDDEPKVLDAYKRQLRKQFDLDTVESGQAGLEMIEANGEYSVIVSDMQMPNMNGVEFLQQAKEIAPDSVRIMLTGNADQETAVKAVNDGQVYRFLTKPCSTELLALTLENGLQHYQMIRSEKELLENTLMGSVGVLTEILSLCSSSVLGQGDRIRKYAREFLSESAIRTIESSWELETAAMLLQIGRVAVPEAVFIKLEDDVPLSEKEQALIDHIPETGFELLNRIPRLEEVAKIIRYQNKNYDGTGMPNDAKSGSRIPEGARILRVLSDLIRLEDQGVDREKALQRMESRKNCYDPVVFEEVRLFINSSDLASRQKPRVLLEVGLDDIQEGDVMDSDLVTEEGMLVLPEGTEITSILMKRLCNFVGILEFKGPIVVSRIVSPES